MITVVTLYRARSAESYVQVVDGHLTPDQRDQWRRRFNTDEFSEDPDGDEVDNLFFCELPSILPNNVSHKWPSNMSMPNVDGDEYNT